jgi:glycosyltransferase involved in cell wall biosynthesis
LIQQQIEGVSLTIIGKNPPADFQKFAEERPDSIHVTGYVPDLDPYMQQAALLVVPVLAGGGMRVRILEAFARAMPVVTTTVGLEGIEAQDRSDVYIGDTPQDFAGCVIALLEDESAQKKLAMNGRRLAENKYDWNTTLEKLSVVYTNNHAPGE